MCNDGKNAIQHALGNHLDFNIECATILARHGADPTPVFVDPQELLPPVVTAASVAYLAALQPAAVAKMHARVSAGASVEEVAGPDAPKVLLTALRAVSAIPAAHAAAAQAHALFGEVPGRQRLPAQPSNDARTRWALSCGLGRVLNPRRTQQPIWDAFGAQWLIIQAIGRRQACIDALQAAEAAAPAEIEAAEAALVAERERQQRIVDALR